MNRNFVPLVIALFLAGPSFAEAPFFSNEFVYDLAKYDPGHAHASCVVECPNGDLLSIWYENGPEMPPPYYSERKDKSDDVRIGASRKRKGAQAWEAPFVIADTFGCSDNNPCMVIDSNQKLWLFYPTLLGVPEKTWGSALIQYKVSSDYQGEGVPVWDTESIVVPKPSGLKEIVDRMRPALEARGIADRVDEELADPLAVRLGWMSRAHPLVRSDGAIVLPVANENFNISMMCITEDAGKTWIWSSPVPDAGVIQPSVVEWPDKSLSAFFRGGGDDPRIPRSESKDGGKTWTSLDRIERIHPGSGLEAIVLASGKLALVHNDVVDRPRNRLSIALSDDQGKTWKWSRVIEKSPEGRFDYPSVIQAKDGAIHVSFTSGTEVIKHARFNEAWVMEGDSE